MCCKFEVIWLHVGDVSEKGYDICFLICVVILFCAVEGNQIGMVQFTDVKYKTLFPPNVVFKCVA